MTAIVSRADAEAADAADELRDFRDRFHLPDGTIYLDGNSLGAPSDAVLDAIAAIEHEWASSLVAGWDRWVDLPVQTGDLLGETLLGATSGQTVVADSTSINLYKTIGAALSARPERRAVVVEPGIFPTDRYIVERLAAEVREDNGGELDGDVALVVLSAVDYRTAERADIDTRTRAAHDIGALILWDLSHAVGALPLALDAWDVDFAVGCTYKYVNAGPGAPAFAYVNRRHHDLVQPIPGWFGHTDRFAMDARYRPAEGIARFLTGTPNIPGTAAVAAGVRLLGDAGIDRVRRKSVQLTSLAIERADALPVDLGFTVASPREQERRGSHVGLRHPDASALCATLAAEFGVVADHRPPDILRLGFAPLYTRFVDVWDAFDAIANSSTRAEKNTE